MVDSMEAVAGRQHGLIARHQAITAGLTPSAIRHLVTSHRWCPVAHGVYRLEGAPLTPRAEILALLMSIDGEVFACRSSAAALHGLPGFTVKPFHALVAGDLHLRSGRIRIHRSSRFSPANYVVIDSIPTTDIARTLFDLAGCLPLGRAERCVDAALSRGLVSTDELASVFVRLARRGRLGSASMRILLEERGASGYVAPESELERRFLAIIKRFNLPTPELQVSLGGALNFIGRVDAYFREAQLVIELDGAAFHGGLVDRKADARRDAGLTSAGFRVARFTWNDVVGHPGYVADRLKGLLASSKTPAFPPNRRTSGD